MKIKTNDHFKKSPVKWEEASDNRTILTLERPINITGNTMSKLLTGLEIELEDEEIFAICFPHKDMFKHSVNSNTYSLHDGDPINVFISNVSNYPKTLDPNTNIAEITVEKEYVEDQEK